jgi:hypothetical protein
MKIRRLGSTLSWWAFQRARLNAMPRRDCSAGSTVFFEAQPLGMQEKPHRAPIGLDAARGQFRRQTARGERPRRDPRSQPIRTLAAQGARLQGAPLVTAHLAWRQRPGLALPLAPFGDARRTDPQGSSDRADRLASLGTLNGTLTQIFGIGAHPCWPPQPSTELESEMNPIRESRFCNKTACSKQSSKTTEGARQMLRFNKDQICHVFVVN